MQYGTTYAGWHVVRIVASLAAVDMFGVRGGRSECCQCIQPYTRTCAKSLNTEVIRTTTLQTRKRATTGA